MAGEEIFRPASSAVKEAFSVRGLDISLSAFVVTMAATVIIAIAAITVTFRLYIVAAVAR